MQISDILDLNCVIVPLQADNKTQAITEMVRHLDKTGHIRDFNIALKAVLERESVRSTGVGQKFAIPHGKTNAADNLVMAVARTEKPIEFQSVDNQPVELIFLLISPTGRTGPHIQALARISRIMTDPVLHDRIWAAYTAEELYNCLISSN